MNICEELTNILVKVGEVSQETKSCTKIGRWIASQGRGKVSRSLSPPEQSPGVGSFKLHLKMASELAGSF